jgi:hypothetical protein
MVDLLPETRLVREPSFVARRVAGELLLVPIRRHASEMEGMFSLNETAAFVWDLFDGAHTPEQLRDALVDAFDVSPVEAEIDVRELILQLLEIGAVKEIEAGQVEGS